MTVKNSQRIVLASSSVYRRQLLERLRIKFEIAKPEVDESPLLNETPQATAVRLAHQKALTVSLKHPGALIIGSDQVATVDNVQLGKPGSFPKALEQLQFLRGRIAEFHTALCLLDGTTGLAQQDISSVQVKFRTLTDAELSAYLCAEEPYDCAGSAKSEGLGISLLEFIHSDDPTSLIGLPLIRLVSMLQKVGYPVFNQQ